MDINRILDEYIMSEVAEEPGEREEKRRLFCELMLDGFRGMTADDLDTHLTDAVILKKGPAFALTFTFPVSFNPQS